MWLQKSREVWLNEEDKNTSYFHKKANAHRRMNYGDKIKINGVCYWEENAIEEGVVTNF